MTSASAPSFWPTLALAAALALAAEGLVYALFAEHLAALADRLRQVDSARVRAAGILVAFVGICLLALVRWMCFAR